MKSPERSRFDAAHELGHLMLHQHGEPNGREAERESDLFASALLMPKSSVLAFAPKFPTVERLIKAKKHWKVSLSALAHRMHSVGMLTAWQYRTLAIEIQTHGYRDKEPDSIPREMSRVFDKVFRALREDKVGKQELARALDWPLSEVNALVFQLVVSSVDGGGGGSRATDASPADRLRLVN
jgi:Zn-dependent peptidase ImmA (M78 family)